MGVGGIPPTEIEAQFRRFRITDEEEQESMRYLLRSMDSEYLAYQSEKDSSSRKS